MSRLAAAVIGLALLGYSTAAVAGAETKTDPTVVWPKNSQFNCSGILIQDEGTYQLKPDEGMLAWCDAEIEGKDKGRVLDACTVGDRCEIKGVIRGHGAFGWVKITSVRSLKQKKSGVGYTGLPKRFWGEWIDADDNFPMKMKATTDSILFGSSRPAPACKFTNIKLANEEQTRVSGRLHNLVAKPVPVRNL
jgi:hypothetical protein